ncbi:MAG: hypothetical protein AAB836_01245 [Patescibacteria group bacterium]
MAKINIRIPRILLDLRNADPKLLSEMEGALDTLDAKIRVMGTGFSQLPHVFSLEEALEEADIWVYLSKNLPGDFQHTMKAGIIPVMLEGLHKKAANYDPVNERGNAFLFPKLESWYIYGSMVRAIENFNFSHDWSNLKSHGKALI